MSRRKRRGVTVGTVIALIMTAVVLAAFFLVMARLTAGHPMDLSTLDFHLNETRETAAPTTALPTATVTPVG